MKNLKSSFFISQNYKKKAEIALRF